MVAENREKGFKKNVISSIRKNFLFLEIGQMNEPVMLGKGKLKTYSEKEILEGIQKGDSRLINYIKSDIYGFVCAYILQRGGNYVDAEKVFHDALIVIFRKVSLNNFQLRCKFTTYFVAVCKKIWLVEIRIKKKNSIWVNDSEAFEGIKTENIEDIEDFYLKSKEFSLYRKHYNRLTVKQQILIKATFESKPYKEIYEQFGYKSVDSFKNEVAKAKRKLFKLIESDPEFELIKGRNNWSL